MGEIAEQARDLIDIPIVKIDDAMTEQAVKQADKIAVIATLPTTLGPTVRLVQRQAERLGRSVTVIEGLAEGAFEAVINGTYARGP